MFTWAQKIGVEVDGMRDGLLSVHTGSLISSSKMQSREAGFSTVGQRFLQQQILHKLGLSKMPH